MVDRGNYEVGFMIEVVMKVEKVIVIRIEFEVDLEM